MWPFFPAFLHDPSAFSRVMLPSSEAWTIIGIAAALCWSGVKARRSWRNNLKSAIWLDRFAAVARGVCNLLMYLVGGAFLGFFGGVLLMTIVFSVGVYIATGVMLWLLIRQMVKNRRAELAAHRN